MPKMEKIVSLAKRRGFVYPSSDIYEGFSAIYDFGPYGVELEKNIKEAWWHYVVQEREDVVGLDSSIFMHPKTWEASGHVTGFNDPLTECRHCHTRIRVDKLLGSIDVFADEKMSEEEINKIFAKHKTKIKCPNCNKSDFTKVKQFNLLVKSNLGNFTGDWEKAPAYLRGETCQGIYLNYKNIVDTTRVKIPFGIAQIGKVFRNEITARKFLFRTREFEQMEMQYFVEPKQELKEYEKLKQITWHFWSDILELKEKNLRWHEHENLVFYAKAAYDIEFKFPWGFDELEGVHARGNYDLTQHSKYSGKDLSYLNTTTGKKYIPHIIESSAGVGRAVFAVLVQAYHEETLDDKTTRVVMKFPKRLAPIKIAVFPLVANKPEIRKMAEKIFNELKSKWMCEFDDHSSIGKRYRRQDEVGTPFCVTVDFDSLKDQTVTVRERDSMKQERVLVKNLTSYFEQTYGRST